MGETEEALGTNVIWEEGNCPFCGAEGADFGAVDVEGDTVVQEGFCRTCNKQWHEFYIRWSALEAVEEANPILSEEAKHFLTCASIAQEGQQWEDTGI